MKVEVIDGKLVLSPTNADEGRVIFALVAAWSAFESVLYPIMGKAVRYKAGRIPESDSSQHNQASVESIDKQQCT